MVAFLELLTNFYLIIGAARLVDLLDKVLVVERSITTKTAIFGAWRLLSLPVICNQLLHSVEIFHVAFIICDRESLADHPLFALGILRGVDILSARCCPVVLQSFI